MQDAKTGGSRWVPDIREDEITEFQEQNGDETATYKAVNVHPIISRVLDKLAFFRTHVSAVWYNKLANKTVKDKLDEIDTSISSLNSNLNYQEISDFFTPAQGISIRDTKAYKIGNILRMKISAYRTDESVFTGSRIQLGTIPWNISLIIEGVGSTAVDNYANRSVGIVFGNNVVYADIQNENTDLKYICIDSTIILPL